MEEESPGGSKKYREAFSPALAALFVTVETMLDFVDC
jgi:hypothetical protein